MPTISGGQTRNLQSLSRQGIKPALRQWKIEENHTINNKSAQEHMPKTCDYKNQSHLSLSYTEPALLLLH